MKYKYPNTFSPCFGKKEKKQIFNKTIFIVESRFEDMRNKGLTAKEAMESAIYLDFAHSTIYNSNDKMMVERNTVGKEDNEK